LKGNNRTSSIGTLRAGEPKYSSRLLGRRKDSRNIAQVEPTQHQNSGALLVVEVESEPMRNKRLHFVEVIALSDLLPLLSKYMPIRTHERRQLEHLSRPRRHLRWQLQFLRSWQHHLRIAGPSHSVRFRAVSGFVESVPESCRAGDRTRSAPAAR